MSPWGVDSAGKVTRERGPTAIAEAAAKKKGRAYRPSSNLTTSETSKFKVKTLSYNSIIDRSGILFGLSYLDSPCLHCRLCSTIRLGSSTSSRSRM